jgi:hypothetical protein
VGALAALAVGVAPAQAVPSGGVLKVATITVDASAAGPLPVATATDAWARNTPVAFAAGPCSGPRCIIVRHEVAATGEGILVNVAGMAVTNADGSCTAYVFPWLDTDPDSRRAALEHEIGHCLGLGHNTSDPKSIMAPSLGVDVPKGPDAKDRANLAALYR